jgi:hypothetical protein
MAHNIYITGIHVEYQTKNSNFNLVLDEYLIILNYIKKNCFTVYYQKLHY